MVPPSAPSPSIIVRSHPLGGSSGDFLQKCMKAAVASTPAPAPAANRNVLSHPFICCTHLIYALGEYKLIAQGVRLKYLHAYMHTCRVKL